MGDAGDWFEVNDRCVGARARIHGGDAGGIHRNRG